MTINEMCQVANEQATKSGFTENTVGEDIALMHSELSEALEEYRANHPVHTIYYNESKPDKPEGVPIELADAVIRIFHFCGKYNIDLEQALTTKMTYNATRSFKHGGKAI
jgi:NTP pyrophosphatase (non-canonical NTP hydrolase)